MTIISRIKMVIALDTVRRNITQLVRFDGVVVGDGLEYSCDFVSLVFSYSSSDVCAESMLSMGTSSSAYTSAGAIIMLESRCNDTDRGSTKRRVRLISAQGQPAALEEAEARK